MIEVGIIVLSIILQLLATLLALRLISLTRHRTAWILISVALVLMIARRITTLIRLNIQGTLPTLDLFEVTGLVVSAFMLAGLDYIRRYLYDTFAAERILHESEQHYRILAQNIPNVAVFLYNCDHRYILAEGSLLQQMGFHKEQFEGKNIWQLSLPDGWTEMFAPMQELALSGTSTTIERPYKGRVFSIQFIPIRNGGGTITSGMAMFLDITEQLKAEKDRIAAYQFLQHTIDGVAEPVMVIGLDYQIKLMNRIIREAYDSSSAPTPKVCYTQSHHRDAPCNDPSHPCPLQQVRTTLMPVTVLHEHQTVRGEIRQVEIIASPLFDENGILQGMIEASRDITERKRAEEEIRKMALMLDIAPNSITVHDLDGCFLYANQRTFDLHGYSRDEFMGLNLHQLDTPESEKLIAPRIRELLERGEASFEVTHFRKDGSILPLEIYTMMTTWGDQKAILSIGTDITERKRAENEKNRLLSAIESSIDGIAIADEHDHYIFVNEAHAKIYGYSQDELIGKTWQFLVPKGLNESGDDNTIQTLRNPQIGSFIAEGPGVRKDGSQIPTEVRAKALWDADRRYSGHICIVVDITKRKQVEEVTRRRTEELETLTRVSAAMRSAQSEGEILSTVLSQVMDLFHGMGVALGTYDPPIEDVVIKLGYGALEKWTGKRLPVSDEVISRIFATGQPYVTKAPPANRLFEWAADAEDICCTAWVPLKTNQRIIGVLWLGRQTVFTDKDLNLLTAIADMTANALQRQALHEDLQAKLKALQEAQAKIIQSEKLAAIGQLTSGIAHELNNPLTSVVLYTQMAQRRSLDDSTKRDLDKIVRETLRASKIVRGLLDFARQHSPETRPVNINDILESVADFVTYELRSHNIQSELDLSPAIPITMADPYQLQQVFINLVNNAWQAVSETRKEGHLWIKTEVGPSTYKVNPDNNSTVIRIIVKDDGPGIPEEHLPKIFDPFFTTKPEGKGTGLGLSICHGIIAEHGGNIWVESKVGLESKFIIELPVISTDHVDAATDADWTTIKPLENSHILIIDDESSVLEVLTRALRGKGYHVEAVSNARDGLAKMAQVDYSAILCDIRMPGISGPGFYKEVRSRNPELVKQIVLMTGDVVNSETQLLIKENNILSLTKPFELSELYRVIRLIENDLADEIKYSALPPQF